MWTLSLVLCYVNYISYFLKCHSSYVCPCICTQCLPTAGHTTSRSGGPVSEPAVWQWKSLLSSSFICNKRLPASHSTTPLGQSCLPPFKCLPFWQETQRHTYVDDRLINTLTDTIEYVLLLPSLCRHYAIHISYYYMGSMSTTIWY